MSENNDDLEEGDSDLNILCDDLMEDDSDLSQIYLNCLNKHGSLMLTRIAMIEIIVGSEKNTAFRIVFH